MLTSVLQCIDYVLHLAYTFCGNVTCIKKHNLYNDPDVTGTHTGAGGSLVYTYDDYS